MKRALSFVEVVSGLAFLVFLIRAGYGVIASDPGFAGGAPDFDGLVKPYLIYAGIALVITIAAAQISKRM